MKGTHELRQVPVVRFKDEPSRPVYLEPLFGEHTVVTLAKSGD